MKLTRNLLLIVLFFSQSAIQLFAAYQPIDDFTQVDGLPCNEVNHIFEDSRGLIWLSTGAGLCEFNGYEVKYRKELNRLQGEKVNHVTEDLNGNLLIAASGVGVCEFNGEDLKVLASSLGSTTADIRMVDKFKGKLLVATSRGLYLEERNGEEVNYKLVNGSENLNIEEYVPQNTKVVIFPKCGFGSLVFSGETLTKESKRKFKVLELGKPYKNAIVIGEQLILRSKAEETLCEVLNYISVKKEKYVLFRYFKNQKEYRKLVLIGESRSVDYLLENHIGDIFIQTLFKHKLTGDLWLGTKHHGLIRLKQSIFSFLSAKKIIPSGKNIKDILALSDGAIVLASNNELVRLKNGKIAKSFKLQELKSLLPDKVSELTINDIERKGKLIWIATNHGFFTLNQNSLRLNYLGISSAQKFIVLNSGELFCYTGDQFVTFKHKNGEILEKNPILVTDNEITITKMLEFDSKVWVSTKNQGIYRFDNDEIQKFGRNNSGFHNVVNDMLILPDSCIIAGGNNGILYKLKSKDDKLIILDSLDSKDGLQGISVHGFQYLPDGSIWCGTNLGVHRFDYKSWHPDSTVRYRFWNSNREIDFRGVESLVDGQGNIWVNSNHTLMKIEASNFNQEHVQYSPSLLGIKIKYDNWKSKKSELNKWTNIPKNPIHLNYSENYVSLNFGMLYCDNLENVRYRYRLVGLDDVWSDWKATNEAVYSNLKGGNYIFEIEARKLSSDKTGRYSIELQVATAWWKTVWFWGIVSIVLASCIYLAVKFYKRKVRYDEKQRTKQFNRVIGLKIKALQYQLDPHFIFNSLNSIQSYILDEEEDKALEYLSDFSMVLRNNINNANKNLISLSDELAYLKLYLKLEQMRFEEKFNFQIKIDKNINPLKVQIPPMLIQPFLEHSIRYGLSKLDKVGNLEIRFSMEVDGYLKCQITDNGKGDRQIDIKNQESDIVSGNSLQITCDRMKLLNKVLSNGKTYSYKINEIIDSKTQFSGVITEIGFPKQSD